MPARNSATDLLTLRTAVMEDHAVCSDICYRAFSTINARHSFPSDFPSLKVARQELLSRFTNSGWFSLVAERGGVIIGCAFLDERSTINRIGPITIDPEAQDHGTGRRLMEALLRRAEDRQAAGVRLVQAAFHNRSLSLYVKLGFDVREPLANLQGQPMRKRFPGYDVRPATPTDLPRLNELCRRVYGHDRARELQSFIEQGSATLVERGGNPTGYAGALGFGGHAVADTNEDLQALIAAAPVIEGPGLLLPMRNTALLRWCLENGLRVVQMMTLMTLGEYREPTAPYLPSINA